MNLHNQVKILLAVAIAFAFMTSVATAHDCFKDPFTEHYGFKSVSCKTCHPDSKKKHHNRFGIMYVKELDGLELTKKWTALEGKDEERAKFEEEMVKEFKKILPNVETKSMTMQALLEAGIINGTRLEKPDDGSQAGAITLEEYEEELEAAEKDADKDMKDDKKDDKKGAVVPFAAPTAGTPALSAKVTSSMMLTRMALLLGIGLFFMMIYYIFVQPKRTYAVS